VTDPTDAAAGRLRALIDEHVAAGRLAAPYYSESDLRAVLDEREQLAAEAVELRAIRDSRVREVRAAHAAGWLDHAEFIAERNRSVGDARETAGQAYTAARIADWHKTEPEATHG
jgi:hypothetical protein